MEWATLNLHTRCITHSLRRGKHFSRKPWMRENGLNRRRETSPGIPRKQG